MSESVNFLVKWFTILKYFIAFHICGLKGTFHDIRYRSSNKFELKSKPNHVAVVTGGARGIGLHIVKLLMECGMHVVIGCRNVEKGNEAINNIRKSGVSKGEASVIELDMKSFKSVKRFADEFNQKHSYLNLLVNNAGIMFMPYEETEDGHELHLTVNYLSHFLLTQLMMPALKKAEVKFTTNPRIVHVASCAHEILPNLDFSDLDLRKMYIDYQAYAQSKLCNLMFSKALARRLKKSSSGIQSISVHPGIVNTDIFEDTLIKFLAPWFLRLFCKSPEQGAVSVVYCCVTDETENGNGLYYSNCRKSGNHKYADDVLLQDKLYEISTSFVKGFLEKTE